MNKFQKVGLAIAVASGMAFASGSLWRVGAPYGIAQFDWIRECLASSDFDETDSEDDCYKKHGGWWFGYVAGPSSGPAVPACDQKRNEGFKSDPSNNYVKAYINGEWKSFVGPDYENCEGPPFTDKEAGGAYLIDSGLTVQLNIGVGEGAPKYAPAIAAIGINFSQPPTPGFSPPLDRNFTNKNGFCLTYELSGLDASLDPATFAMELGWNEDDAAQEPDSKKIPYDTWYHPIPVGNGIQVKNFPWTAFEQVGWSTGPWPLSTATNEMRSLKIRLKVPDVPYDPVGPVTFKLIQLGWLNECDNKACKRDDLECIGSGTPIISSNTAVASASFKQVGKTFSLLSSVEKPVAVQVINLQGAIVYSQTMSANSIMNLNNLPTGIYMLRVPALGYTNKVILK